MNEVIVPKKEFEPEALTFKEKAAGLEVKDQATYSSACEMLLGIKDLRKEAESHHRPMIEAAHKSWKTTLAGLQKIDDPLAEAERILKRSIGAYESEQRRIQEQLEREAREAAERAAAEALESSIEAAEAEGATVEEVQAIINQPMPAPVVYVAPTVQKVSGVSTAKTYRVEVFNLRELCKAVVMGTVPEAYVTANMPSINGVARSTQGSIKIPGIRIVEDTQVRAGRR
jgi:hypothetical protein